MHSSSSSSDRTIDPVPGSDPMEWIGWNVLLEGRKHWTFLPPSPELDARLETYRLPPNAFGPHNISAGWQSDTDLYRQGTRTLSGDSSASWPSTREAQITEMASSGVQEPGDVVIIPPRHWHQVKDKIRCMCCMCCTCCMCYSPPAP